jgi:hypothetical protein
LDRGLKKWAVTFFQESILLEVLQTVLVLLPGVDSINQFRPKMIRTKFLILELETELNKKTADNNLSIK